MPNGRRVDGWKTVKWFEPIREGEWKDPERFQTPDGLKSAGITAVTKRLRRKRGGEREGKRRLRLRIVVQPRASTISRLCLLFFTLLLSQSMSHTFL